MRSCFGQASCLGFGCLGFGLRLLCLRNFRSQRKTQHEAVGKLGIHQFQYFDSRWKPGLAPRRHGSQRVEDGWGRACVMEIPVACCSTGRKNPWGQVLIESQIVCRGMQGAIRRCAGCRIAEQCATVVAGSDALVVAASGA